MCGTSNNKRDLICELVIQTKLKSITGYNGALINSIARQTWYQNTMAMTTGLDQKCNFDSFEQIARAFLSSPFTLKLVERV